MSSRALSIGRALQGLEPEVMDLVRMSHLVSRQAECAIRVPRGGEVSMPEEDANALLFGVYELDDRLRKLRDSFYRAFETPDA